VKFIEVLQNCKGNKVLVNNAEDRELVEVEEDFIILSGGNPQMRITEFIQYSQIVRVIRADFTASGDFTLAIDLNYGGGDARRAGMH
jgi:hypothetical protein